MSGVKNRKAVYIIALIGNFVLFFLLYALGINFNALVTFIIYGIVTAGFVFSYLIYNRGLSRLRVTPDMCPPEWPEDKKLEFVADGKRRIEKSKWMLTVIIPLIAIYGYEVVDQFIIPAMKAFFA